MKIVQLVTRNCVGGVQVVAQSLNEGFRAHGHDASIWFFCGTDEETIGPEHSRALFARRPASLYYPRMLLRLLLLLMHERPDVVIAHTTNTAVPGLILTALAGIRKRIAVQHNPLDTYSTLARAADRFCAEAGVYWRNVTVANTVKSTMQAYSTRALARVQTIHNGMKPVAEMSGPTARNESARGHMGLSQDVPLVLNVGRLAEQKNQVALVEAMSASDGAVLVIAGDGPLRAKLQAVIEGKSLAGRVRLLGAVSAKAVGELMQTADIFVTPAHFEAMPMAVLEAMQYGLAILASDIAAHRELLGDAGLLVPPTAQGVASGLQRLLADTRFRGSLGTLARKRASLFSEEGMVQRYLSLAAGKK